MIEVADDGAGASNDEGSGQGLVGMRERVAVYGGRLEAGEYVYEALRAGASGFLLKDAPESQLLAAIRVVAAGGSLFAPSVTRRLIQDFAQRAAPTEPPPALAELTDREGEVLRQIARGLSNTEIAAELIVSEHTAKSHVSSILRKLDLRDRVQAVVLAYECGLIQPGETAIP